MSVVSTLPGPRSLPYEVLTSVRFHRDNVALLEWGTQRYGDLWRFNLIPVTEMIVCSNPELTRELIDGEASRLYTVSDLIAKPFVGEHSVLVYNDAEHRAARNMLDPLFTQERVKEHADQIEQICAEELATLRIGERVKLLNFFERLARRIIVAEILGDPDTDLGKRMQATTAALVEWGYSTLHVALLQTATVSGRRPPASFVKVREPIDAVIFEAVAEARRHPALQDRPGALASLVAYRRKDGSQLTDQELRSHIVTILLQGHTSTAASLAWAFERLMRHPESMQRVREEAETDRHEYVDAVIAESLRLRPPIPWVMRKVHGRPFTFAGLELPPDTVIACNVYLLHMRDDLYPNAREFRPERFQEDSAPFPRTFGGGYRGCLGIHLALLELRLIIRQIARTLRLEPVDPADEKIGRRGIQFVPAKGAQALVAERY